MTSVYPSPIFSTKGDEAQPKYSYQAPLHRLSLDLLKNSNAFLFFNTSVKVAPTFSSVLTVPQPQAHVVVPPIITVTWGVSWSFPCMPH